MKSEKCFGQVLKAMLCVSIIFNFQFSTFNSASAQKYAVVNTDYVLRSIPDYSNAIKRLDKYVEDWKNELAEKAAQLEAMRVEYEQESYLLPENLKKRRKEEIAAKEQELKALQQQRFGPDGDLDKKRAELLKPVQDRVFATIERVAHEKNYAFVFDKAGSATVLFASKKYDISDEVLEMLGYKPGAASGEAEGKEAGKKPTNPEMRPADKSRERSNPMREIDRSKNKQ
jgi:outer membrane protein